MFSFSEYRARKTIQFKFVLQAIKSLNFHVRKVDNAVTIEPQGKKAKLDNMVKILETAPDHKGKPSKPFREQQHKVKDVSYYGVDHYKLKGKRILVTGAAGGIGSELVKVLAHGQAEVIAVVKPSDQRPNLGAHLEKYVRWVEVDLTDWEGTRAALQKHKKIYGLVNAAGIVQIEDLHEVKEDTFDMQMNTNFKAVINICQFFQFSFEPNGAIVNLSSFAGTCGAKGN